MIWSAARLRGIAAGVLLALTTALAWPASAHTRSQSMSSLTLAGDTVTITFQASAREVTRLGVLDPQAVSLPSLFATHLAQSVTIERGDAMCALTRAPAPRRASTAELRFELTFQCPATQAQAPVRVTNNAFFPVASRHIHFARARAADGAFEERLMTATNRTATFVFSSDGAVAPIIETASATLMRYVSLGTQHILEGIDHVAFLIGLLLLCRRLRDVVFVVTGFTIGHSITLSLAVLGLAVPNPPVVEALIAFTIMLVAVESLAAPRGLAAGATALALGLLAILACISMVMGGALPTLVWVGLILLVGGYAFLTRDQHHSLRLLPWLTGVFGLVHGFGFAGVLLELGLPAERLALALFGFNVGVELGQLLLVIAVWSAAMLVAPRLSGTTTISIRTAAATVLCIAGSYWFAFRAFA